MIEAIDFSSSSLVVNRKSLLPRGAEAIASIEFLIKNHCCLRAGNRHWQFDGAIAVDMESHIVATVGASHGLPVAAMRVITDPAERGLPACTVAAMRPNGTTNIAAMNHVNTSPFSNGTRRTCSPGNARAGTTFAWSCSLARQFP